jgi:hypothetical protein
LAVYFGLAGAEPAAENIAVSRLLSILMLPLALLAGCGKSDEKPADDSKTPAAFSVQTDTNGNTVVTLSVETQKRIALEVAPVASSELAAQIAAFGTVLDPAPLLALHGELAADQAALDATRKVAQRARTLFSENENVSQKSVESAEVDEKNSRIKFDAASATLRLEWGDAIANLGETERGVLVDSLAGRRLALARVDLTPGESLSNLPARAIVSPASQDRWTAAQPISFATTIDPKTLGEGILLRLEQPDALLAPGAAVKAMLPIAGPPTLGILLPEAAVLHFGGRTWVYAQSGATNFVRREVSLDTLLPDGWFATNGPAPGDRIVTTGASLLLSQEQQPPPSAGSD